MSDPIEDFLADSPAPAEKSKLKKGEVDIRGKVYRTVALRLHQFREEHPDWSVYVKILHEDADTVRMRAVIRDASRRLISTGMASETRTGSRINQTSHIENCETSAIGRALAFAGYGGEELSVASAEEMTAALAEQDEFDANKYLIAHNVAWRDNHDSVQYIKEAIRNDDIFAAVEGYAELGHDVQTALHVAPTKGGCWTIAEKKYLRSDEFNKSMKEYIRDNTTAR